MTRTRPKARRARPRLVRASLIVGVTAVVTTGLVGVANADENHDGSPGQSGSATHGGSPGTAGSASAWCAPAGGVWTYLTRQCEAANGGRGGDGKTDAETDGDTDAATGGARTSRETTGQHGDQTAGHHEYDGREFQGAYGGNGADGTDGPNGASGADGADSYYYRGS